MKNLGTSDRLLRVILAELCFLIAIFWVAQEWQIPLYLGGGLVLVQAAMGRCGLYGMLGWNSCEKVRRKNNLMASFAVVALTVAVVGGYASFAVTKNIFLEDLGSVKEPYSLTLRSLSQGQGAKAIEEQGRLEIAWKAFDEKYSKYRPICIRFDENLTPAMQNITAAISRSREDARQGNLAGAHDKLQKAEQAFQEISGTK